MPHRRQARLAALVPALPLAGCLLAGVRAAGAQAPAAPAAGATVRGVVVDAASGDSLPAWLAPVTGQRGVRSDDRGRFVLRLAGDLQVLRVRALGHRERRVVLALRPALDTTVTIALDPVATTLGAVRTVAPTRERQRFGEVPDVGSFTLAGTALRQVPAVGEADLLRAIATLPGASARNDFVAGVNVRGGEADQNLVLLDGIPVHNPFHLGGLFGTFIDDAVARLDLATAAFPASMGGRLSSALDVESAEEARTGVHGGAALSLLASHVTLGGALPGAGQTWNLAVRRTYADVVADALTSETLPYHFHDAQLRASTRVAGGGTLALTAYTGRDAASEPSRVRDECGVDCGEEPFFFRWGNDLAGVTWSQPLGSRASLVHRAYASRFGAALDDEGGALVLRNVLLDLGASGRLTSGHGWGSVAAGWELARQSVRYRELVGPEITDEPWDENAPPSDTTLRQRALHGALWAETLVRRGRLLLRPGVRAEAAEGAGWLGASPRVTAKLFLGDGVALTAGASRHVQLLHAVRNEDLPIRIFDVWMLSRDGIAPSRATHLVGGAERWWDDDGWVLRLEGWHKRYHDLAEPPTLLDPRMRPSLLRRFDGRSYGGDLYLRRLDRGRLGGWLSYGYAVSRRWRGAESYAPAQDRRHNANVVVGWRASRRWIASGRLAVASGTPYTPVTGWMPAVTWDPGTGGWVPRRPGDDEPTELAAARNSARYPLYARLDLGAERAWYPSSGMVLRAYGQLVNVTNRHNVFLYDFALRSDPPRVKSYSQFPLLPTLGMKVEF